MKLTIMQIALVCCLIPSVARAETICTCVHHLLMPNGSQKTMCDRPKNEIRSEQQCASMCTVGDANAGHVWGTKEQAKVPCSMTGPA